jgi:hypothetical protein
LALPADIGASLAALSSTVRITESDDDRWGETAHAANTAVSGARSASALLRGYAD